MAKRIDALFTAWSGRIVAHPWIIIVASLLIVGAAGTQIRHVTLDFTPESFLSSGHPERELYNDFRRQFGTDNTLVVAVRPADPWSPEFLGWLRDLHERLERDVPYVDDAAGAYPQWSYAIENDTEWSIGSTLRVTIAFNDGCPASCLKPAGTYFVKVVTPNGVASEHYFSI